MEEVDSMPSNSQEFCLRWNNFHSSLVSALDGFKNDLDFVDVTLACEGQFLKAHKMLLSACSVFFRDLLKANPCQHPIVILPPEVRFIDLEKMLRFIYQGEVNVHQENLARFLKTAEMLKIRGLAEDNEKQKVLQATSPRPPENSSSSIDRGNNSSSVSPKRPRLSIDTQSGSLTDHPHTPIDENSHLSGGDSDSEMIPVKQEMIELKECDFDNADDSFLTETYLRENVSGTCSNNTSNSQSLPTHPAAPPPPGPLLPSYVPPPQIKAQDDSPDGVTCQEDVSQGTSYSLVAADHIRVKKENKSGDENKRSCLSISKKRSSNEFSITNSGSRYNIAQRPTSGGILQSSRKSSSPGFKSIASSPPDTPKSSLGKLVRPSSLGDQGTSPARGKGHVFSSPPNLPPSSTGSSLSIWHPPQDKGEPLSLTKHEVSQIMSSPSMQLNQTTTGTTISPLSSNSINTSPLTPLTCDICCKSFTSRSNLNKHKRVQHSGEEYRCPNCQRTFKSRYYIKDHVSLCSAPHKMAFGDEDSRESSSLCDMQLVDKEPAALVKVKSASELEKL